MFLLTFSRLGKIVELPVISHFSLPSLIASTNFNYEFTQMAASTQLSPSGSFSNPPTAVAVFWRGITKENFQNSSRLWIPRFPVFTDLIYELKYKNWTKNLRKFRKAVNESDNGPVHFSSYLFVLEKAPGVLKAEIEFEGCSDSIEISLLNLYLDFFDHVIVEKCRKWSFPKNKISVHVLNKPLFSAALNSLEYSNWKTTLRKLKKHDCEILLGDNYKIKVESNQDVLVLKDGEREKISREDCVDIARALLRMAKDDERAKQDERERR